MADDAEGTCVVGRLEPVEVIGINGESLSLGAKIDTGAKRSSIEASLIDELGMPEKLEGTTTTRAGESAEKRELIPVYVSLIKYESLQLVSAANIKDRSDKTGDILIGYDDLNTWGVNVDPGVTNWDPS